MSALKNITNIILLGAFMIPATVFAQDRVVPNAEIPPAIQQYVKKHFPNQSIVKVEMDMEGTKKEYEIKLDNRTELEFNGQYQVEKIDGKSAIPASSIPAPINEYVKMHYPNNTVTEWETEWNHQEVKLDNGIELEFDLKGAFIRIDN